MNTLRSFQPRSLFAAALGLTALLTHFTAPSAFAATYYWDCNTNTTGFGTLNAASTWSSAGTAATATNGWSTSSTGIQTGMASVTTLIGDALHFGTDTSPNGLAGGTLNISGTVNALSLRFGSQTTASKTLSGGTINLAATTSIHVGAGGTTVHTISSQITGAGTSLTKTGNILTLSGSNTFSGTTIISAGELRLGNVNALQNTTGITIGGASAATLAGSGDITGIVIGVPITLANSGVDSTIAYGRSTATDGTLTLNGAIGGNGNLILTTPNANSGNNEQTIVIGAAGTYAGTTLMTTVTTGNTTIIRAGVNNALPVTTVLTMAGGTGSGSGRTVNFNLNGKNQQLAGLTNITAADRDQRVTSTAAATLTISNTVDYTFAASATGGADPGNGQITGAISLTKNGSGTFTLGAGNGHTFTGTTRILGGILSLGHATSIQNSTLNTQDSITGDAVNGLRTTVTALTFGGINGNKNLTNIFTTTSGGYDGLTALTLNIAGGDTRTYPNDIGDGAGGMTLTKSGAGTQILTGINTHSGNTTINAGKLQGVVGGSSASSTLILNAATATNSVSITDNTKGWTNAAFTAAAAGVLEFNFGAVTPSATVSPFEVTGAATFTATPTVRVVVSSGLAAGTYPLMRWGSTSGTAPTTAGLTVSTVTPGTLVSLEVSGNTLNLVILAESVVKADNTFDLTNAVSWVGGVVPGSLQRAKWDATVTSANTTVLGADTTWTGIVVADPAGLVTINAGNTLTLGAAAIDINMTNATSDLTLNCALALGAANVWDVTNSRTLTVGGAVTGGFGITKQGAGTAILSSGANAYSGATALKDGTVQLGADNALPTGTALTIGADTTVGTLDLATYNQTVGGMVVASTNDIASTNVLIIGAGKTFTVSGGLTNGINATINTVTKLTATGAGTLSVTGGNLQVGGSINNGTGNAATLDLSGLGNFSYNNSAGTLRVGDTVNSGSGGTGSSTLILAATNTITALSFSMDSPTAAAQLVRLGSVTNSINADTITIGANAQRSPGSWVFDTATGNVTIRNTAGTGRANMNVGYANATTGVFINATNDLTGAGHSADLFLGNLLIGGRINTQGAGSTGIFSFENGTLDVTSVIVGDRRGTNGNTGPVIGTLNLGGGTVTLGGLTVASSTTTLAANTLAGTVNITGGAVTITNATTSITLGSSTSATAGATTAALNLTGGTLTVAGDIVKGSAVGPLTSTLNLNGASAILNMGGKNITGLTGITYTDGTLTNLGVVNAGLTLAGTGVRVFGQGVGVSGVIQGEVSGSGVGLTKTGSGTLTLTGTNTYSGATLVSAGKLAVLSTNASTGAVTNTATLGVTAIGVSQWSPASLSLADPCTLEFSSVQNPSTTTAPLVPTAAVGTVANVTININSISGAVLVGNSYPLLGNQDGTTNGYTLGTQPLGTTGRLAVSGPSTLVYIVETTSDVWLGTDGTNPTWWDVTNSVNWTGGAVINTPPGTYTNGDFVVFEDTFSPASPVTVALQTPVTPSGVTFDNSTKEYIVTASGANVIGSGTLTKSGTNTVTLAGGAHTYSGATTISGGTLQLGDGTSGNDATIASSPSIVNSGALVYNRFGSASYGGVISGSGTVTKSGAGTQTLSGTNTYTGATTISGGTLSVDGAGQLAGGSYAGTITNDGTLTYNSSAAQTLSGKITGVGGLNKFGSGTLTLSSATTAYTNATSLTNGTLVLAMPSTISFASAVTVNSGTTLQFSHTSASGITANNMGAISLAGTMTYSPTANAHLVVSQTAAQPTTVSGGSSIINISPGAAFAASKGGLYLDGGLQGSTALTVNAPTNGFGLVLRTTNSTYSGAMIVNGTASTTAGTGSGLVIGFLAASANATLPNADLTINGTLELGNSTAGMGWAAGTTANLTGQTFSMNALNGTGVIVGNMATAASTRGLSVGNNGGTGSFSGVIANGGNNTLSLTKAGSGIQTLSGTNTYTGATTISGGTLQIGGAGQLGSGSYAGLITNNAALDYASSAAQTLSGVISGGGSLTNSGAGTLTLTGANTYGGGTTISTGKLIAQTVSTALGTNTVAVSAPGTLQINHNIAANTAFAVGNAITGAGNLEFTGISAPTSSSTRRLISVGSLSGFTGGISVLTNGNYLASTGNNTTNQNLNIATGGYMTISTHNGFGKLDGAGTVMRNAGLSDMVILTLGNNDATGGSFSGAIIAPGLFSSLGNIAVTKVGSGTQTLSGTNTYAGATTISGGTLALSGGGSITNSPSITVNASSVLDVSAVSGGFTLGAAQTLKGNGSVNGVVTVNGTIAPGASIGTLTLSNAPSLSGTIVSEVNSTNTPATADNLTLTTGTLTYGGALVVTNLGPLPTNSTVFTLFTAPGNSFAGSFSTITLPTGNTNHWKTASLAVNGTIAFSNAAPVALAVTSTVAQGESVSITNNPGKLPFATDADGDPLTFALVTGAAQGTVSVLANGFTYNSTNTTANITDTFQYSVADGFGGLVTNTMSVYIGSAEGANLISATSLLGKAYLTYLGIPGQSYVSELATNLLPPITWTPVATNTAGATNGLTPGMIFFTNDIVPPTSFFRTQAQ